MPPCGPRSTGSGRARSSSSTPTSPASGRTTSRRSSRPRPPAGSRFVGALDGTTNALGLSGPAAFAPVYGPGSASRFQAHAAGLGLEAVSVAVPNLAEDVDTLDDLHRLRLRCGPHTQACLAALEGQLA